MLLLAPCHRGHSQAPTPGAVFTAEMISEATIDRIVELLKLTNSGNDFLLDFVFLCSLVKLCYMTVFYLIDFVRLYYWVQKIMLRANVSLSHVLEFRIIEFPLLFVL